jgi:F-box/WD-40 domain protein 5
MHELYKFYNKNASSIRAVMVANCPWLDEIENEESGSSQSAAKQEVSTSDPRTSGNPLSHVRLASSNIASSNPTEEIGGLEGPSYFNLDYASPIHYSEKFRKEFEDSSQQETPEDDDEVLGSEDEEIQDEFDDDLENCSSKYLIFSTGSRTYTPHQIGFKRIGKLNLPKTLDPGPSLQERIALRNLIREQEVILNNLSPAEIAQQFRFQNVAPRVEPNWADFESVQSRFDKVDKLIDLNGHIIGMALSPDQKYLYVNSRPWPSNSQIQNPLEPPPIAQEIDIHVIDLTTLKEVGTMLRAHKAYTPNTDCFFIFLDVCDNYVAR